MQAVVLMAVGLSAGLAWSADLLVLSAGAIKPALDELAPTWSARTGTGLRISYAPAGELRRRLAAGERADIVILPVEHFAALEAAGVAQAGSRRDLGAVGIGVAVPAGAPLPDISSEEALKKTLIAARSVSYMDPRLGTSGKHIDEVLLPRLGLREAVRAKAQLGEGGMLGEKAARGEVDLVFQQMTELLPVSGIRVVGELPAGLQKLTLYSAAMLSAATAPVPAQAFLDYLTGSTEVRAALLAKGFKPPP